MTTRRTKGFFPEIVIDWGTKDGFMIERAFQFLPYNAQSTVYEGLPSNRFGSMNSQRYDIQKFMNVVEALRPCLSKTIQEVRETFFYYYTSD